MSKSCQELDAHLYCFSPDERDKNPLVYDQTYSLYKTVWSNTFLELNGSSTIYSNEFSRQDIITSLSFKKKIVACVFLKAFNFENPSVIDDSYFGVWDKKAIKTLTSLGPKVLVGSHLTVHPSYRGHIAKGKSLKNIILDASVNCLSNSDCSVMTGVMRCNKGMDSAARSCGAQSLQQKTLLHGIEVDLVAFYKGQTKLQYPNLSTELWGNKLTFEYSKELLTTIAA